MKTTVTLLAVASLLSFTWGCNQEDQVVSETIQTADLTSNEFAQSQAQIHETLDAIFKSIQDKDADKLISFHDYGPKFTEFKDGEKRTGPAENEAYERGLVGAITAFDYDLHDLQIDVFGNVGKVTFHADFRPTIEGQTFQILSQATLIFVRVGKDWKIVHEHLSPLLE